MFEIGLSKKTRALITTQKAWASPIRGQNSHSPPPFWKLGQRTKNL